MSSPIGRVRCPSPREVARSFSTASEDPIRRDVVRALQQRGHLLHVLGRDAQADASLAEARRWAATSRAPPSSSCAPICNARPSSQVTAATERHSNSWATSRGRGDTHLPRMQPSSWPMRRYSQRRQRFARARTSTPRCRPATRSSRPTASLRTLACVRWSYGRSRPRAGCTRAPSATTTPRQHARERLSTPATRRIPGCATVPRTHAHRGRAGSRPAHTST
jgi:hypothetical protein